MWIARFKVWHDSILAPATAGLDVTAIVYYLNFFAKGKQFFHNKIVVFSGSDWEKAVGKFRKMFKCEILEIDGNKVFFRVPEQKAFHTIVLTSGVFLTQPIVFKGGYQYWEVAGSDKRAIQQVYSNIKRLRKGRADILWLKKARHIMFAAEPLTGRLSDKQREAFNLCVQRGFYDVPRRKNLEEIAKEARVPYSTFRERLQRAESILMHAVSASS